MDEDNINNNSIDTSIEFTPQNPFNVDIPNVYGATSNVANPGFPIEPEKSGIIETAEEEFKKNATLYHLYHRAIAPLNKPADIETQYFYPDVNDKFYHPAPPGWNPKQEIDKQTNIDPKYIPKLMTATNPDDFNFQLADIKEQEHSDEVLQNGSFMGKILGGGLAITIGSPENFVPLVAIANKAKVGAGFISGAIRNIPGIMGASAIHEGATEMDKIDGNLPDFLKDTFIDTVYGAALFGTVGAGKSLVNIAEYNKLKQFGRDYLDGIGFNYKVDKDGNHIGFEAVDTTGSLSAAKVTKAQEHADAAFFKGGLYKVPYVGEPIANFLSGHYGGLPVIKNIPFLRDNLNYLFGSPLLRAKLSKYPAMNAFADAAFDHFITTEGEAKGGTRPDSFELKQKMTNAMLTKLKARTVALKAEANGYNLKSKPAISIQDAWHGTKQKTIETLSKESKSTDWMSDEDFMDAVQHTRINNEPHENAAINEAAAMYHQVIDTSLKGFLKAYNLPEDYYKNTESYLSRVYHTPYMIENEHGEHGFVPLLAQYYKEADDLITQRMMPIENLKSQIKDLKDIDPKHPDLSEMRIRLKQEKEKLQNELRSNSDYDYHVTDKYNLSSDEANELTALLKPLNELKKKLKVEKDPEKIADLKRNIQDTEYNLYDDARNGKINPRLINPLNQKFRDPKKRLKFRKVFGSHEARLILSQSQYDSILKMQPQDVISDIFGRMNGNAASNPLKKRTLMVPDKWLYDNKFMTKDIYAKTANYVKFLTKKTHLKESFDNVTVNGNLEELAVNLLDNHNYNKSLINKRIEKLKDKKQIAKEKKNLTNEALDYNLAKEDMKQLYETRMMGINNRSNQDVMARRVLMALTAMINLHNLPATQVTDLGFAGFQHGIWNSIRDGIYPFIESLGGMLKTKDSEAVRKMAPHIHLALQDELNHFADRNWSNEMQPYINNGKIVGGIEKIAHFSSMFDLVPQIDNGLQRINGGIVQSKFMEHLFEEMNGTLTPKDSLYMRKYGIDPKVWANRMTKAYKESGGFKAKLGGFVSKSWEWQDLEAANLFNKAVFRGIQNTLLWKGMADSPFFSDNIIGMFFHTFTGWGYAAINRYLIPSMQHPDASLLLKMLWMGGAGALVSPIRRISRGENPWPDNMSPAQHAYEAWNDSGLFSLTGNLLNWANLMSDGKLLGELKNDKFRNRMRTGIFGMSDVMSATMNRIQDVLGMAKSGIDEQDMKAAARMLPITGAMYMHYMSDKMIESWNLPRNRRAAENQ